MSAENARSRMLLLAVLGSLLAVFLLGRYTISDPRAALAWTNGAWTLASLATGLACLRTARRFDDTDAVAWRFFGAACLAWFLGMLIWDYHEFVARHLTPFPALSDIGFLGFAPLFAIGAFYYQAPTAPKGESAMHLLNLGIVACATIIAVTIMFFELIERSREPWPYVATALAYPALYLTAFFVALKWLWTNVHGSRRHAYGLLVLALGLNAVVNTLYAFSLLGRSYATGHYLDAFWLAGFGLIYWAANEARHAVAAADAPPVPATADGGATDHDTDLWLVGIAILAVIAVTYLFRDTLTADLVVVLSPLGVVLLAVILVREWWRDRLERSLRRQLLVSHDELLRSRQRLVDAQHLAALGYFEHDLDTGAMRWSEESHQLFKLPARGFLPTWEAFLAQLVPADREVLVAAARQAVDSGEACEADYRIARADGAVRNLHSLLRCVRDPQGGPRRLRGTLQDVTARRRAETEAVEARKRAEIANRTKTEFLANMSHELRTPLNSIIGFSELMSRQGVGEAVNERHREYCRNITAAGKHLLSILSDVLDVSRIEVGGIELIDETVDLHEVISSSRAMVARRASEAGVDLTERLDGPLPQIRGDSLRLKQILLNLLVNAIKFTPAGGTVVVGGAQADDGTVRLFVEDTGPGIPAQDLEEIFKPFFRVGDSRVRNPEGTGLGLTIVKSLTELHGGRVEVESTLGQGTTMTVRLPAERTLGP